VRIIEVGQKIMITVANYEIEEEGQRGKRASPIGIKERVQ
jgi:hypothetical protein